MVLVVAGSSPVDHPWYFRFSSADFRFRGKDRQVLCPIGNLKLKIANFTVPVAQPDRASDFGSEGWGFESLQARHLLRATYADFDDIKKKLFATGLPLLRRKPKALSHAAEVARIV